MTVHTSHLGPGTLTLGAGALAVEGQITNCRVEASESVSGGTDPIPVLSGEEVAGEDGRADFTWTLAGELLQDWQSGGVTAWTWANKGTPQPFTFRPDDTEAAQVTGVCYPIPITFGGAVTGTPGRRGAPLSAAFSWRCKGGADEPDFTPNAP